MARQEDARVLKHVSPLAFTVIHVGAWCAILAAVSFIATIVFLSTQVSALWSPHKAISDIGALGGPWSFHMNWFGFILPGLMVIPFSASLMWRPPPPALLGPLFVATGGGAFAAAGAFPFPLRSHYFFSATAALFLGLGIWILAPATATWTGWKVMSSLTRITAALVVVNIVLPWLPIPSPGHYQKASLLLAWSWFVAAGWTGVQARWSDG